MVFHNDSLPLLHYLQRIVSEISSPLEGELWKLWEPGDDPPDALGNLDAEIARFALYFANSDGEFSECEASIMLDIHNIFALNEEYSFSVDEYRELRVKIENIICGVTGRKLPFPLSIKLLRNYDDLYGSSHSEKLKVFFWRLANVLMKADGKVTQQEQDALSEFQRILFQQGYTIPEKEISQATAPIEPNRKKEIESRSLEQVLDELNALVGLEAVKGDVVQLVNFLKVQQLRQSKGLATVPVSRHLVFYGNPGTGKTTVARLLSQIYKSLNIISGGHLVETDRSGLVAGYVGQTALKVQEVVNRALGGVLFIDEAYALVGEGQDYGREAVDTLIKLMEDHRDDLIVVVAGYTDKMNKFLLSNPGLRSRFNKYFLFEDYSSLQLTDIFKLFCKNTGFQLSVEAREKALAIFQVLHDVRDETFGNARLARNVFEKAINNQANRIISLADISEAVLSTIEAIDVPGEVELHTIESIK